MAIENEEEATAMVRTWRRSVCAWLHVLAGLGWVVATLGAVAQPASVAAGERLPVETFYRFPDIRGAELSPTGKRLAVALRANGRIALGILDLEAGAQPTVLAHYTDADVSRFWWINDERLVFDIRDFQRGAGDQLRYAYFTVKTDGGSPEAILGGGKFLMAVPAGGGDEIVIGEPAFDGGGDLREVRPARFNLATKRSRSLALGMPDGATGWVVDPQGEPRLAIVTSQGVRTMHWRAPGSQDWHVLAKMPAVAMPWRPHSVDERGALYVTESEAEDGFSVLKRFDFATKRPALEALVRTPGFDFTGQFVRDVSGPVLGVRVETDAQTTVWFDPAGKRWQSEADQRLPGRVNRLTCRRCSSAEPVVLVESWSDQHPGEWWLLHPGRTEKRWNPLGQVRRDVERSRMATLDLHRIKARDGLEMPVWLTLPPSANDKKLRPAVVLVHGGPWMRGGHWRWNPEAQFLASRGYVVIEPEFRGSTGYGNRLYEAGRKQWGRAMQDDLADAVRWAVERGWVDARRVCIAGGGYGGYAALMGPIREPSMFRCAAAWGAVTDPSTVMDRWDAWNSLSDEYRRYALSELIGDPRTDAEMLREISPLVQAARLKAPVFLAYGAKSRLVPVSHGERFRDALGAAGNEPEWLSFPDESTSLFREANRYEFARRLEKFLAKHLD